VRLQPIGRRGERNALGGETISEGVPRGAVQVLPNGEPIILLADHQTTGGYRVPAVVASDDLWRVAQLRPGNTLRFALVTVEAAVEALRVRAAWLERFASNEAGSSTVMSAGHDLADVALLMRGFSEWSDEEDRDEE
jgi:allophanate hydrolase subunit 2